MKIAMFTNPFAPIVGGIEKSVAVFAEDLRSLGHDCLVIAAQVEGGYLDEENLWRIDLDSPDEILSTRLAQFAPDLIHAHQAFLLGETAFESASILQVPLVFTHHTLYGQAADLESLSALATLETATRQLAIAYSDHCTALIAPTESVADELRRQGVSGQIEVIPTGIEVERFAQGDGSQFRRDYGIPDSAFVIGHLGRLIPAKRVRYLAHAMAQVLRSQPQAYALICGQGEEVAAIREIFVEAGVIERCVLLGILPETSLASAYAAMDLFTFASLSDTQGIVLLEAMGAGLPVVAHEVQGPRDLVVDGEGGRLLDPAATSEEFAALIESFFDPAVRAEYSHRARERARRYDRRVCAKQLITLYESLLGLGGPSEIPTNLREQHASVESEWRRLARSSEELRALLPTRGFPL